METITSDVKRSINISLNLEQLTTHYIMYDLDQDISVTFPSFDLSVFEDNMFILMAESKLVDFKQRWEYRPEYVSYDYYNTTIFANLIMSMNYVLCAEEFCDLDKIMVPTYSALLELGRSKFKNVIETIDISNTTISRLRGIYENYMLDDDESAQTAAITAAENKYTFDTISTPYIIEGIDGGVYR